jgi:hypothetical protein
MAKYTSGVVEVTLSGELVMPLHTGMMDGTLYLKPERCWGKVDGRVPSSMDRGCFGTQCANCYWHKSNMTLITSCSTIKLVTNGELPTPELLAFGKLYHNILISDKE